MKKYLSLGLIALSLMSSATFAKPRLGVELTSGSKSIGVLQYDDTYGVGVYAGGNYNNASDETQETYLGGWAELRQPISADKSVFFAYGISGGVTLGKTSGNTINSSYTVAPFLSLEKHLSESMMFSMWTDIISIGVSDIENTTKTETISLFSTHIAAIYFFN